jgi:hypothetical protein
MEGADHQIGDAEDHPVRAEGTRRCERDDQHRRDRGEHGQPHGAFLRIHGIGQPGVRGPGPPERAEQQRAPQEATPGRAAPRKLVTCVMAKTTTRSKKSSSGVTRCPRSACRSPIWITSSFRLKAYEFVVLGASGRAGEADGHCRNSWPVPPRRGPPSAPGRLEDASHPSLALQMPA